MESSMQEVQTNKSEQLVPIDTSGNAVDVELKEETSSTVTPVNENDPIVEVTGQETTTETKPEELEEYSAGVKKRIDKLTKKNA